MLATRPRRAPAPVSPDADEPPPLLRLLDAAEDAGELDVRQLARTLGLAAPALRAALARPGSLDRTQRDALGRALGIDAARLRALLGPAAHGAAGADGGRDVSEAPGEAPRSVAEALERAVLAIDDAAPWGRSARLALLEAVERRAAEAGRAIPRELHALRARVRAGRAGAAAPDAAPDGESPRVRRGALAPDAERAVDEAARVVAALQQGGAGWDDLFAPIHDDAVAALLRRHTLAVHEAPLGATSACVVSPPLYGRGVVVLSADAGPEQRRLALRVALAHAAAGHVREERPLPFPAPPHEARVAALVALADLVPFWQLAHARGPARMGWARIAEDVARQAASLAGDWPWGWAAEVAALRVALFRRTGL